MSDSDNELKGTPYERLSVGPLRFDDWLNLESDEVIEIKTFRHPIVLVKYAVLAILFFFIGTYISYITSMWELFIVTILATVLISLYSVISYWSIYYIITNKQLIKKQSLFLDNAVRKSANRIQNQDLNQSFLAKFVSIFTNNYAMIEVQTASGHTGPDIVLNHVPNPNEFTTKLQKIQSSSNKTDGTV